MRILFVSGELIAGDLPWRLKEEGNEVKLYVGHPLQAECQNGFVERVANWRQELGWVGKDGLIVFDDVGYGQEQDNLREEGYRVFGGSAGGDRLEQDREYGQKVLRSIGLNVEPTLNFATPREAIEHIRNHKAAYVVKQNNHQSALNYVGELETGEDVLSMLKKYESVGVSDISLQKKLRGVEVGVARYFNGNDWVGPIEISFEHKDLFNDDIGPKTGEMGTLAWYDANEDNPLFKKIIEPLKKYLQDIRFKGDISVNSFVHEHRVSPIEFTARIGCPIIHLQGDFNISPWGEFLAAIADGKRYDLQYKKGYGIVLTLALPPFPYEGISNEFSSDDLEIFFRDGLSAEERKRIHFEGVKLDMRDGRERYFVTKSIGYTMFVTGIGEKVEFAQESAYSLAKKVIIPKIFYRTDIGSRFLRNDHEQLKQWGWL